MRWDRVKQVFADLVAGHSKEYISRKKYSELQIRELSVSDALKNLRENYEQIRRELEKAEENVFTIGQQSQVAYTERAVAVERTKELESLVDHLKAARRVDARKHTTELEVFEKKYARIARQMFSCVLEIEPFKKLRRVPFVVLNEKGGLYFQTPGSRKLNGDVREVDFRKILNLNQRGKQVAEVGENLCNCFVYDVPLSSGEKYYGVVLWIVPAHKRVLYVAKKGGAVLSKAVGDVIDVTRAQLNASKGRVGLSKI